MEEKNVLEKEEETVSEKNTVEDTTEKEKDEKKEIPASDTESEEILKAKKAYKKGRILDDIGMGIFSLFILLGAIRYFMKLELFIGGSFVTNYLNFLLLIPCIMMIAGLAIMNKSASKLGKKEKGGKPMFIAIIIAAVVIFGLSVADLFHPSYHVYEVEKCTASDGREFTVVKSERVAITAQVHSKIPSFYDIDVYDVNGIFARRLCSKDAHKGSYNIEKTEKGYRLNISYLGMEEGIPFKL